MSLLFSPRFQSKLNQYIPPSGGDIDLDPELIRETGPFLTNQEKPEDQIQESSIILTPKTLTEGSNINFLPLQRQITRQLTNRHKECTTQDKIYQVHNGQYVINALKNSENHFSGESQLMSKSELKQLVEVNYKKQSDGTLEMVNQRLLKKQKQVLGHLVKQFGSALFTGKSITNVSLPVSIFEAQSHLEREARNLCYAPHFLEKGGDTTNPLYQFKLAIAHFITSLHLTVNPQKPFNPIVGETFQGKIGDCPVYIEQISHHPPVMAIQLYGKSFTFEEQTQFTAAISMNSVKSAKAGSFKVTYKNMKTVIRGCYPQNLMSGTAIGKRTFQFTNKFYMFDLENKYYAEIHFDKSESSIFRKKSKTSKDQFSGAIWKINDVFVEELKQIVSQSHAIEDLKFKEKDHAIGKLENIEGSWLEHLMIGNQVYWSFGEILPYKLQYSQNPLPSDSNYRLDVLYLRAEDEVKCQRHKEILEEGQRNDRKLRENYNKKNTK